MLGIKKRKKKKAMILVPGTEGMRLQSVSMLIKALSDVLYTVNSSQVRGAHLQAFHSNNESLYIPVEKARAR